jgi:hypothetical protein
MDGAVPKKPIISPNSVGRTGEFLVMSKLEYAGSHCVHSDATGDDIWVRLDDGNIRRVQVKSAHLIVPRGRKKAIYKFMTPKAAERPDFYAFVAIEPQAILFRADVMVKSVTTRIYPDEFTEAAERETMLEVLSK